MCEEATDVKNVSELVVYVDWTRNWKLMTNSSV